MNDPKFVTAKKAYERAQRETDLAQVLGDPETYRIADEKEKDAFTYLLQVAESLKKPGVRS